jgi:hypothetical protein
MAHGLLALVAALVLSMPLQALAGPIFGHAQVQYQTVGRDVLIIGADGTTRQETINRSLWLQSYELNYATRFENRLQLLIQGRLTDMSVNGRVERQTIPEGSLRLVHSYYGFMGRYRPLITRVGLDGGGLPLGGGAQNSTELKSTDTQITLTGYAAPPRLPRLDLSWIRRTRDSNQLASETQGDTYNGRLGYVVGRLGLRAEYGGWRSGSDATGGFRTIQTNTAAGVSYLLFASPTRSFDLRYDISNVIRNPGAGSETRTLSHNAGMTGNQRFSSVLSGGLNYNFRRTDISNGTGQEINQQSGAMQVRYTPKRSLNFTGAWGVRSLPRGGTQVAQTYLSNTASARGKVLPGWDGQAGLSYITNWTPGEPTYSIGSLRLASTFTLARGLDILGDAALTDNGNPVSRATGSVVNASAGFRATPRRSLTLEYRYGIYRAGPRFGRTLAHSRSWKFSLDWQMVATLRFSGVLSRAGALPNNDPDVRVGEVNLKWTPSRLVQLTAAYTRSDRAFLDPTANALVGTELASLRWVSAVGRSWTINADYSISDPGDTFEARQLNATLTYSFGR